MKKLSILVYVYVCVWVCLLIVIMTFILCVFMMTPPSTNNDAIKV